MNPVFKILVRTLIESILLLSNARRGPLCHMQQVHPSCERLDENEIPESGISYFCMNSQYGKQGFSYLSEVGACWIWKKSIWTIKLGNIELDRHSKWINIHNVKLL